MQKETSSEDMARIGPRELLKELIDFIEAGISTSKKLFHFLVIRLKRELSDEEAVAIRDFLSEYCHLSRKYPKKWGLPMLPAQIQRREIHLYPKLPKNSPLNQTSGTTVTILRLSQALQRDFGIAGEFLLSNSLKPFDERMP